MIINAKNRKYTVNKKSTLIYFNDYQGIKFIVNNRVRNYRLGSARVETVWLKLLRIINYSKRVKYNAFECAETETCEIAGIKSQHPI